MGSNVTAQFISTKGAPAETSVPNAIQVTETPNVAEQKTLNSNSTDNGSGNGTGNGTGTGTGNGTGFGNESILVRSKQKNVLSTLRSYTYNFTLACLSRAQVGNPKLFIGKPLQRVILKSAGKEPGMRSTVDYGPVVNPYPDQNDRQRVSEAEIARENLLIANDTLLSNFELYSAGRFNMFIENVEIESTVAFTEQTNTTMPTKIRFDIIEPYSVNGFLEALAVAAAAAGYQNYAEATFVLLVEFQGYPDSDQFTDPIILDQKRYFTFNFVEAHIDITERGTKYSCLVAPNEQLGYGVDGKLKNQLTATGNTVGELLRDLVDKKNEQLTKDAETELRKGDPRALKHHIYKVRFDGWSITDGFVTDSGNEIEKSILLEPDKHARTVDFQNPDTAHDGNQNYRNATPVVQTDEQGNVISSSVVPEANQEPYEANNAAVTNVPFDSNENLYEIISNICANSSYVRKIIKSLFENKGVDAFVDKKAGMIKYFAVRVEAEENVALGRDEIHNRALKIYTYVISPYQVHFSRIPNFARTKINQSDLETRSSRSYNYIYTGENQEILNFKLQYNYMYYEGMPQAMGINDRPSQDAGAKPNEATQPVQTVGAGYQNEDQQAADGNGLPTSQINIRPDSNSDTKLVKNILQQDDPYFALANNLHRALIDPNASMIQAEIEILGDPFFLVTGGIGNQIEKPDTAQIQTTESGQLDHLVGDCIIDIKFKNPDDIGPDGFMAYNQILNQPFQGAYRVLTVLNTFRDGLFKQNLTLNKIPGQDPQNKNTGNILANSKYSGTSNEDNTVSKDTRNTSDVSLAPSGISVPAVSNRGFPTPDSRFTGNAGGFGIKTPSQVFGALSNGAGRLTAAASIFGGAIPGGTDQSSPIRLNPASLINGSMESVNSTVASAQAAVAAVQNFNINSVLPSYINNPTIQLSGLLGGGILSKAEEQLKAAESTVAANIDLYQSAKEGVSFKYVTDVANVPPVQGTAKVVLEHPPLSVDEQAIVAKGGLSALAESRGVSVTELPANIVSEANSVINLGQSAASEIKAIIGRADAIINQGKTVVSSVNPLVNIVSKSG
jgi:hypothetical protein